MRKNIALHWYIIALISLIYMGLFGYHLATRNTPDPVFITIPVIQLDVFWYGLVIMGGIVLGCYVVGQIAYTRAIVTLHQHVPTHLLNKPIGELSLPKGLPVLLQKNGIKTSNELILRRGFGTQAMGLKSAQLDQIDQKLRQLDGFEASWLTNAPWRQWNPDIVWSGVMWALVLGVIGARVYHILTPSPSMAAVGITSFSDYLAQPWQMINIRNGGLGIYGAVVGGVLGITFYMWRNRYPWLVWLDLAAVGTPLGQFVGRWANFFNQELYGGPTDLPWGITIDRPLAEFAQFDRFHPAFLYESVWSLITFLVLYYLATRYWRQLRVGELAALYLIFYGFGRILVDLTRLDSATTGGLTTATVVSLISIILSIGFIILRRRMY